MSLPPRALSIEDDADLGKLVRTELESLHYCVDWLADGALGPDRFQANGLSSHALPIEFGRREIYCPTKEHVIASAQY